MSLPIPPCPFEGTTFLVKARFCLYLSPAPEASSAQLNYESMHTSNWPTPSTVLTGVAVFAEDIPIRPFLSNNLRWCLELAHRHKTLYPPLS